MQSVSGSSWLKALADPRAWSLGSLVITLVVSTIVFAFGNLQSVGLDPVTTLGANTLMAAAVFGLGYLLSRTLASSVSPLGAGIWILLAVLLASALRGIVLHALFLVRDIDASQTVVMRAVVSVSVFAPGVLLSALVWVSLTRWQADEARIRELADQREQLRETVTRSIEDHTRELTAWLERELSPRLASLPAQSSHDAQESLRNMVSSIIRPVSVALHSEFPSITPPPPRTASVAFREFISRALTGSPLAPLMTGVIFGLTLLPRNLATGTTSEALSWTAGLSASIVLGTWIINRVSPPLGRHLPLSLHAGVVVSLLMVLGAGVALLARGLSSSDLGFDNVVVVGAAATTTLSLLLGGVVNAGRYFTSQRELVERLGEELEHELAQARQLRWQRNRTLGTIMHGSLQAALNAGSIRLAAASNPDDVATVAHELAQDVSRLLLEMRSLETMPVDLHQTIQRIGDTWEDICALEWTIEPGLIDTLRGQPVSTAIADALTETVYNAIKHQEPPVISIRLDRVESGDIRLEVIHPGHLSPSAAPGLGTKVLDYLTLRHSLSEHDGLVQFEGYFPGVGR